MSQDTNDRGRSRVTLVLVGFGVIAAFLLLAEHRAHVLPFLPWLLLAACPLMHVFMHRGHGHGGHQGERGDARDAKGAARRESDTGESSAAHTP